MKISQKTIAGFLLILLAPITAITVPSLVTFTNGTVADATQVNANFQAINDYLSTNVPASSVIYSLPEGVDTLDVDPSDFDALCNDGDGCDIMVCATRVEAGEWDDRVCGLAGDQDSALRVSVLTSAGVMQGLDLSGGNGEGVIVSNSCVTNNGNYSAVTFNNAIDVRITGCDYTTSPSSGANFTILTTANSSGWTILKNYSTGYSSSISEALVKVID